MRRTTVSLILFLLLFASAVLADQVVLKNGDRLTGSIEKSDDKSLVIKTEFAGEVTIQWDAITSVSTTQDLHVALRDGQTAVGPVTTTDGNLQIATKSSGTVSASRENVTSLRSESEQAAWEKQQHPGFFQGWAGGATVGFALTRGNSETKNLALAFTAARTGLRDKLALYTNSVYSSNDAAGAVPSTTANTVQGGIRYDHDLTHRLFAYAAADFQTDELQLLNLRSVFGGGLGVHLIKSDATTFDLLGGINYTRENYDTFTRNFAAASIGEELMHKIGASTVLNEKFFFFPDLTGDPGEYRMTFNVGTTTKLNKWFGWQNAFGDIYVTNPPLGTKKNDVVFTTGLNLSFTH
jgi:putative salt-induced outer membrane protein YdiY